MNRFSLPLLALALVYHPDNVAFGAPEILPAVEKPETAVLTPPLPRPASLSRWLGHETSPERGIGRAVWLPDGSRMLTESDYSGFSKLQVWKPDATGTALGLEGSIPIGEPWALSPDGKLVAGYWKSADEKRRHFGLYRMDTLEGLWAFQAPLPQFVDVAISKDSRWLAISHYQPMDLSDKRQYAVSIFEAATGKRVHISRMRPDSDGTALAARNMAFGKQCLWLAPSFDEDGRVMRLSLDDWKMTPATEPVTELAGGDHVTLSADESWLVVWDRGRYRAMQVLGDKLAPRFEGQAETMPFTTAGFQSINISPDSTLLTVSGNGRHKVIRLRDKEVVHEDKQHCLCGTFSPDGRNFWSTCQPFRVVRTDTWAPSNDSTPGHRTEVEQVEFSPDGRYVATQSKECIYVWSLDGATPPRRLEASREDCCLLDLEWKPDGTEIWSGDGQDFIRWRLAEKLAPGAVQRSEKLFPGSRPGTEVANPSTQRIRAIPGSQLCYLSSAQMDATMLSYHLYEEVRDPERAGRVQPVLGRGVSKNKGVFSSDGSELIYLTTDNVLTAFKWSDATERKGMTVTGSTSIAGRVLNGPLVVMERSKLTLVDPGTLQPVGTISPPAGYPMGGCVAVSPDGQWAICSARATAPAHSPADMFLVSLKRPGEAFSLGRVNTLHGTGNFSPDGRTLALGHQAGAVSLWDIEKSKSTPVKPLETPQPQQRIFRGERMAGLALEWPGPGLPLNEGDAWTFLDDAAVECKEAGTVAGRMLVNGKPPLVRSRKMGAGIQGTYNPTEKRVMPTGAATTIEGDVELRSEDGRIRVNRTFKCFARGTARWIDTVENVSAEPVTLVLSYTSSVGSPLAGLRTRDSQTPAALPDGTLNNANSPITELGAVTQKEGVERMAAVAFATPSAPIKPVVRWDEKSQSVTTAWTIRLLPFEKRLMLLDFMQARGPGSARKSIPGLTVGRDTSVIARLSAILNGVSETEEGPMRQANFTRNALDGDGMIKDNLGFRWKPMISAGYSVGAELGADRVFDLWLEGAPVVNAGYGMAMGPVHSQDSRPCTSVSGQYTVKRRQHLSPETGTLLMQDDITNTGSSAAVCKVALNTVALTSFTQVLNADGRPVNCNTAVPMKSAGGQIALLSEGAKKPAIILGVGSPTAKVQPMLRMVAGRGFFLGYELNIEAGQTVSLLHFATQRPLSAYDSAKSAFAELDTATAVKSAAAREWSAPVNW